MLTTDELRYHEATCELQHAMKKFLDAYAELEGKRKDLYNTPAIQSCLGMILDFPDKTETKTEVCSCGSKMEFYACIPLLDGRYDVYRCRACFTERYKKTDD